jgi:hypothetical protein
MQVTTDFYVRAFVHSHLMIQMAAVNVRKLHAGQSNDVKHFVMINAILNLISSTVFRTIKNL